MYDDLDRTLESLLKRDLTAILGAQVNVSFEAPDNDFAGAVKPQTIDLFLYDVRENRDLRNVEPWIERTGDGKAKITPAPVRIDCSYLITAWPGRDSNGTRDEHHLLGEVTRVLLRYPTLPQEVLQGELKSQELPLPTTTLQPGRLQSLGEFWQALGGKPKAALNFQVTIALAPFEAATVPVVLDKRIGQRQLEEGERP